MNQTDYDQFLIFYPPLLSGQISDALSKILLNCLFQERPSLLYKATLLLKKGLLLDIDLKLDQSKIRLKSWQVNTSKSYVEECAKKICTG